MGETHTYSRILKSEYPVLIKSIISGIEGQALSIGWLPSQLEEFSKTLECYVPFKIGEITLQGIEILILHNDGSHRGTLKFYNLLVDQPWIKHAKIRKAG